MKSDTKTASLTETECISLLDSLKQRNNKKKFSNSEDKLLCEGIRTNENVALQFLKVFKTVAMAKKYRFSVQQSLAVRDSIISFEKVRNEFFFETIEPMYKKFAAIYKFDEQLTKLLIFHSFCANGKYSELRTYKAENNCKLLTWFSNIAAQKFHKQLIELGWLKKPDETIIDFDSLDEEETMEVLDILVNDHLKESLCYANNPLFMQEISNLKEQDERDCENSATSDAEGNDVSRQKFKKAFVKIGHKEMHDLLYELYVKHTAKDEVMRKLGMEELCFAKALKVSVKTLFDLLKEVGYIHWERWNAKTKKFEKVNLVTIALSKSSKSLNITSSETAFNYAENTVSHEATDIDYYWGDYLIKYSDCNSQEEKLQQFLIDTALKCNMDERMFTIWRARQIDHEASKVIAMRIQIPEYRVNQIFHDAKKKITDRILALISK